MCQTRGGVQLLFFILVTSTVIFTYQMATSKRLRPDEESNLAKKFAKETVKPFEKRQLQREYLAEIEAQEIRQLNSWNETKISLQPKLCVIVRAIERQKLMLIALVWNLIATKHYHNFKIILTDTVYRYQKSYLKEAVSLIDDPRVMVSPLLSSEQDDVPKENTSGYEDTNAETERLLESGECDYFLYTNGDNQYAIDFLDRLYIELKRNPLWITIRFMCKDVSHRLLQNPNIDLGASIVSKEVFERIPGLKFLNYKVESYTSPWHDSDMLFHKTIQETFLESDLSPRIVFLDEALFNHI